MDHPLPALFALGILLLAALFMGRTGLRVYEQLGLSWQEEEQRNAQRLESDVRVGSVTSDGFEWFVRLQNRGRTTVVDYDSMDVVVQYSAGTGDVVTWLPYAPVLQPNSWTALAIDGDAVDLGEVNQGETLLMELCLDPSVPDGTTNWLQVSTELGVSASSGFSGVPVLGPCAPCTAGDTGWQSPAAQVATSGGDGNGFEQNPMGAFADGSGHATNADGPGDRHLYYDYNFAVSSLCAITGVEVRLDWWMELLLGTNSMSVELSWDGGATWTAAQADTATSASERTGLLGGPTDTWGRAWTPQELVNSKLRVRVTGGCTGILTCDVQDFFLDWIPVRVYVEPR